MTNLTSIILIMGSLVYMRWGMPQITEPKHQLGGAIVLLGCGSLLHMLAIDQFGFELNYYVYMSLAMLLLLLAIGDSITCELPVSLLIFGYSMSTMVLILTRQEGWYMNILSSLIGFGLFYGLGKLFRGGIGEGDAHVIAIVALNLGWVHALVLVLVALLLSSLIGIGMMVIGGKSKQTMLPFVPFIALAHLSILMV